MGSAVTSDGTPPRVLVTGSRGFIGGSVARSLAESGWPVTGLHRGNGDLTSGELRCDLLDPACAGSLTRAIEEADAVLHAAAEVRLWGRGTKDEHGNVATTRRVVEACEHAGRPTLVFLSSASVAYRRGDQPSIDPQAPLPKRSLNAYAASKVACEAVVRAYRGPWIILRPQAVIGHGDRHLLPPILDAARRGRFAWLGMGNPVRADLLSIGNLVHCCTAALGGRGAGGSWYLSDGAPQELEPLIRELLQRAGIPAPRMRIPATVARALASLVESGFRVVAPLREPPIHRFGIETMTRTRIVDPGPMLGCFGPLPIPFREGFEAAIAGTLAPL